MSYELLNKINSPSDLKELHKSKLEPLCSEIREFLIEKVGKSGGHLASNLGVTELSVAIHRVFDSPHDHIIFDVGHQAYVHKLITGRREDFDKLRVPGGLSGFTLMRESEHDAFGAGHSSTSISASLGYAEADKLTGSDAYTVCVIGDGAYTGGMVHEAINNCHTDLRLIIIINENGMSISSNKGAFASYLSSVRASRGYRGMKRGTTSFLMHIPLLGKIFKWCISAIKKILKRIFFTSNYFEDLGFYYIGPIDGNDYDKVEHALNEAKDTGKCVFIHLKTTKGKGLYEAEESPEAFHSVTASSTRGDTFHSVFAEELISLAQKDGSLVAVTAAMGVGTGLSAFEASFPKRYFDVGIAEEHALTFSAGLAAAGMKPYTAIYSTFLQRGYDNLVHDVALQGLPVRLFIDRAGISVSDGATHHGIFDVAFLSEIPGFEIYAPATYTSLKRVIGESLDAKNPIAVRYSNSGECDMITAHPWQSFSHDGWCRCDFDPTLRPKNIFVTYGMQASRVIMAKKLLLDAGIDCGIVLIEQLKPYTGAVEYLSKLISSDSHIVYAEEGIRNGGAGMITRDLLLSYDGFSSVRFDIAAINDDFLMPTKPTDIYDYAGLSPRALASYFHDFQDNK